MTEPRTNWTAEGLADLRMMRHFGADLDQCAEVFRRPRLEVNLALDALLGRTCAEAVEVLNSPVRPRSSLRRFVDALFAPGAA